MCARAAARSAYPLSKTWRLPNASRRGGSPMHRAALTPPSQLSAIDAAPSLRYFVLSEPPFDAVIAAVNRTDRLIDDYSQYKHGGEIWWIRALVSKNLSSWRTSSWKDADVIVPPLPFGFCANDEHSQHPACVATRSASKALLAHAALAARPEAFLVLGTDWRLRGSRPLGDARGFIWGTKLPSDPDVGQASSVIVPSVSSAAGRENGPAWWAPVQPIADATQLTRTWHQSWTQRPIRSFFVGQASSELPALIRPNARPHAHAHAHPHVHQADSREAYATRLKLMQTIDQLSKKGTHSVDVVATTSTDQGLPPCDEACASSSPGCVACYWSERMYSQYQSLMHSSKFGWHIRGDTDSSNRLYDVISSGAVPLIIGEGMRASLPFKDLPWDDMVAVARAEEVTTIDGFEHWLAKEESVAPKRLEALQTHGPAVLWHVDPSDVALRVLKEARSLAARTDLATGGGGL